MQGGKNFRTLFILRDEIKQISVGCISDAEFTECLLRTRLWWEAS
jgi:hypothetical protein